MTSLAIKCLLCVCVFVVFFILIKSSTLSVSEMQFQNVHHILLTELVESEIFTKVRQLFPDYSVTYLGH